MNHGTSNVYAWIDTETTGLNPEEDHLLEIAIIMTTSTDLREIRRMHLIVHQPPHILDNMNSWCQNMHRRPRPDCNGNSLADLCTQSTVTLTKAEKLIADFLDAHRGCATETPKWLIMCGSTIDFDKKFLLKHMPSLKSRFHYRVADVSSLMEFSKRFFPGLRLPANSTSHCAMDDIYDSLNLLRFLRKTVIVSNAHHIEMPDYISSTTFWGFDAIGAPCAPHSLGYLDTHTPEIECDKDKIKRLQKEVDTLSDACSQLMRTILNKNQTKDYSILF